MIVGPDGARARGSQPAGLHASVHRHRGGLPQEGEQGGVTRTGQGLAIDPAEGVTILFPCLNEAVTLPGLIDAFRSLIGSGAFGSRPVEILVSDNGSTDGSVDVARVHGARVVHCPQRGYGAALRHGIEQAVHPIVIFLDADSTYDPADAPRLLAALAPDTDMVVGSRLDGDIQPGAMPTLHRYLGTPVLTALLNLLFGARPGTRLSDCNSGYRCFRRAAFLRWNVTRPGMEFASEMLIRALQARAVIRQTPISLRRAAPGRVAHLHTWRDGMRHLLCILVEAPGLFARLGLGMMTLGWLGLLAGLDGPQMVGGMSVFGIHSQILAMLVVLTGQSIWSTGLAIAARHDDPRGWYRRVLALREDTVFWILVGSLATLALTFGGALYTWGSADFRTLHLTQEFLIGATVATQVFQGLSALVSAFMLKKH